MNVSRYLFSTTSSSQLRFCAHPPGCHPERSEGSAFLSPFNSKLSTFYLLVRPLLPGSAFLRRRSSHQLRLSDCQLSAVSCQPLSSSASFLSPFNFELSTFNLLVEPRRAPLDAGSQLTENPATLSPVPATLTSRVKHNPFVCHSYRKHRGGGAYC